jgi:hypothetical protein
MDVAAMTIRRPLIPVGHSLTLRRGPKGTKWISDGIITFGADDSVEVAALTAPPPDPVPSPQSGDLFMAPSGNDANPGTLASPKRTILAASALLKPGQTLWARGGTYSGQGGYNWKSSGLPGAPVAIRRFADDLPSVTFDGANQSHGIIIADQHDVVIGDLDFRGFGKGPSGDGTILLLNASGILIEDCGLLDSGITFQQDHHIYVNSGCADITIRRNFMDGTPGAAVHLYHDPGPTNVVIEDNTMRNGYWGVVIGSNADGVRIDNNPYSGNTINVDNQRGIGVVVDGVPLATGGRR